MMFGSSVLEIGLGLTLIYTMFSLVCTAANELIASVFTWRARNLAEGMRNLLSDTAPPGQANVHVSGSSAKSKTVVDAEGTLAQQLYDHPLVQSLYRRGHKPSYIPSRTFALALMDLVLPSDQPRPTTIQGIHKAIDASPMTEGVKRVLRVLTHDAANTLETGQQLKAAGVIDIQKLDTALNQLHENIEVWFNNSMERVSGWYKRKTQALTFALALSFTVALNVDTIQIVKRLSYDSALRQSLVAQAEKLAEQPPASIVIPRPTPAQPPEPVPSEPSKQGPAQPITEPSPATRQPAEQLQTQLALLSQTGIPLGWSGGDRPRDQGYWMWWLTKFFGLLLTAAAASLGAPFWFDILNKIVTVRSAGKAPEESPKRPKEVPRPVAPGQSAAPAAPATATGRAEPGGSTATITSS